MLRNLLLILATCLAISGCAATQAEKSQNSEEWRIGGWMNENDGSADMTPYRIHGGVGPASSSI